MSVDAVYSYSIQRHGAGTQGVGGKRSKLRSEAGPDLVPKKTNATDDPREGQRGRIIMGGVARRQGSTRREQYATVCEPRSSRCWCVDCGICEWTKDGL
jgi:hypothetical protein